VETIESLQKTVEALKEVVELLIGQRAPEADTRALLVADLGVTVAEAGLVTAIENLPPTWDDLRFPASAVRASGPVGIPSWDTTVPGWLFAGNSTEMVQFVCQLPHEWATGTELRPHVHWMKTTSAAGNVQWQLDYAWAEIGGVVTAFTPLTTTTAVAGTPDTDTQNKHLISAFAAIDTSGKGLSDMLMMKLSRIGGSDSYGSDVRMIECDFHHQRTMFGSFGEYS